MGSIKLKFAGMIYKTEMEIRMNLGTNIHYRQNERKKQ